MSTNSIEAEDAPKAEKTTLKKYEMLVVPWYSAHQFKKVYYWLFSPKLEQKRWALDQISVWETRCHPSLPAAIEASYGLTSAVVQDILWMNGASFNQQLDIQYIYSSAITRFVNLTVELHAYSGTMATMAKGLGIPAFIIDLRNEASHSIRPSLSCLRIAADIALKYLKESYWDPEFSKVQDYTKKPIDVTHIKVLIDRYQKYQLLEIHSEAKNPKSKDTPYASEIKKVLKDMEVCIKTDKRMFIKVLSSLDGAFIPNEDDLKLVVSERDFIRFQGLNDEDPSKYSTHFDANIIPKVPLYLETMWFNVIALLNAYDAVPILLESLLKTQADRTVAGQKLIISWVIRILKIHNISGPFDKSNLKKLFKKKGIVVNWQSMFYAAVANPCKYTPFVFPLIFCNLNLKKHVTQRILNLVAIYLGQTKDATFHLPKNPTIFTVEQLKQIKKLQKAEREKLNNCSEKNMWSPVTDDNYKTWPIGHILNPVDEEKKKQPEEDNFDAFVIKDEFTEKFIINNENDNEEESSLMDTDSPNILQNDVIEELQKRKSFLYTK